MSGAPTSTQMVIVVNNLWLVDDLEGRTVAPCAATPTARTRRRLPSTRPWHWQIFAHIWCWRASTGRMRGRRVAAFGVLQKTGGVDPFGNRQLSRLRPRQQCLPADEPARDKIDGRGEAIHAAAAMTLVQHDEYGRAANAHENSEEELPGRSPSRARRVTGEGKSGAREVREVAKADDCSQR